ncbi:hypothetical protein OESDEN_01823 [Oesophagostomum dentatum]|uniref:Uncharacterized protein n=1 Tax=Oesophagostomum dentatum TaxID=61180 RepID=A0A0B1TKZ0_OESDE|nr:hypothetical protein OESDEN_01823 [Oesophagostomum dentatum]
MTAVPQFQTGEIITFYMLGFTILMTATVVVYYKFLSPNMSGHTMGNLVCKGGRGQKLAKCEELVNRYVRRRKS